MGNNFLASAVYHISSNIENIPQDRK